MAVYLDTLLDHRWVLRGHPVKSCHMTADTANELHRMAKLIGLKRQWFQGKKGHPHYDLTASRRKLAVQNGAKELDLKEYVLKVREIRIKQKEGTW